MESESLQTKIARIDERVNEMYRVLLGNHQQGKIAEMEQDIRALEEGHAAARGEMRGAYWVAGVLFAVGHALLMLYVHWRR